MHSGLSPTTAPSSSNRRRSTPPARAASWDRRWCVYFDVCARPAASSCTTRARSQPLRRGPRFGARTCSSTAAVPAAARARAARPSARSRRSACARRERSPAARGAGAELAARRRRARARTERPRARSIRQRSAARADGSPQPVAGRGRALGTDESARARAPVAEWGVDPTRSRARTRRGRRAVRRRARRRVRHVRGSPLACSSAAAPTVRRCGRRRDRRGRRRRADFELARMARVVRRASGACSGFGGGGARDEGDPQFGVEPWCAFAANAGARDPRARARLRAASRRASPDADARRRPRPRASSPWSRVRSSRRIALRMARSSPTSRSGARPRGDRDVRPRPRRRALFDRARGSTARGRRHGGRTTRVGARLQRSGGCASEAFNVDRPRSPPPTCARDPLWLAVRVCGARCATTSRLRRQAGPIEMTMPSAPSRRGERRRSTSGRRRSRRRARLLARPAREDDAGSGRHLQVHRGQAASTSERCDLGSDRDRAGERGGFPPRGDAPSTLRRDAACRSAAAPRGRAELPRAQGEGFEPRSHGGGGGGAALRRRPRRSRRSR